MKRIRITEYASPICWWQGHLGEEFDVIEVDDSYGYVRICIKHIQDGFEEEPYFMNGWINPLYVEVIE